MFNMLTEDDFYALKYKSIIRMNLDLTMFILEIICLKNKGWGLCNKP